MSRGTEDSLPPLDPPAEADVNDGQADPGTFVTLTQIPAQWYTAAERKAQLLLTVSGAFVTIVFSALFSRNNGVRTGVIHFGTDTRVLSGISAATLVSAIACAGLSLWSLHGKGSRELELLGINPNDRTLTNQPSYDIFGI
jgi:hypothetical protein